MARTMALLLGLFALTAGTVDRKTAQQMFGYDLIYCPLPPKLPTRPHTTHHLFSPAYSRITVDEKCMRKVIQMKDACKPGTRLIISKCVLPPPPKFAKKPSRITTHIIRSDTHKSRATQPILSPPLPVTPWFPSVIFVRGSAKTVKRSSCPPPQHRNTAHACAREGGSAGRACLAGLPGTF